MNGEKILTINAGLVLKGYQVKEIKLKHWSRRASLHSSDKILFLTGFLKEKVPLLITQRDIKTFNKIKFSHIISNIEVKRKNGYFKAIISLSEKTLKKSDKYSRSHRKKSDQLESY